MEFKTQFFKAKRQCSHILSVIEKPSCYVRALNPSIEKKKLEALRRMLLNKHDNSMDIRRIIAPQRRSQRVLMKHEHVRRSIATIIRKKSLSLFMLGDTLYAPCTGAILMNNEVLILTCIL